MDPATIRFQHSVPHVLFSASPPLAALHAVRARSLHPHNPPSDTSACSRCGSLLVQHSRVVKNKKHNRILHRSCRICGAVTHTPLPTASFPPVRIHGTITSPPLALLDPSPPPPPKCPPPTPPTAPTKQHSRPKKKSGLQHLLTRNRENEERERQKQNQSNSSQLGGLAAFLSDL